MTASCANCIEQHELTETWVSCKRRIYRLCARCRDYTLRNGFLPSFYHPIGHYPKQPERAPTLDEIENKKSDGSR